MAIIIIFYTYSFTVWAPYSYLLEVSLLITQKDVVKDSYQ